MQLFKAIKLLLTLNCEQSARIVSDSLDGDLSRLELWAARLHRIGCRSCRRFAKQVQLLHIAAQAIAARTGISPSSEYRLSHEARSRISAKISESNSE